MFFFKSHSGCFVDRRGVRAEGSEGWCAVVAAGIVKVIRLGILEGKPKGGGDRAT